MRDEDDDDGGDDDDYDDDGSGDDNDDDYDDDEYFNPIGTDDKAKQKYCVNADDNDENDVSNTDDDNDDDDFDLTGSGNKGRCCVNNDATIVQLLREMTRRIRDAYRQLQDSCSLCPSQCHNVNVYFDKFVCSAV